MGESAQSMPHASPYRQQHSVYVVLLLGRTSLQVRSVTVCQQRPWKVSCSLCSISIHTHTHTHTQTNTHSSHKNTHTHTNRERKSQRESEYAVSSSEKSNV